MVATVMERDLLKLMLSQDTSEEDMDMVVMVDMVVDTMERGRLMLSQDTLAVDTEAMADMVMEDVGAMVMERDLLKLMPSQDTTEEDMEAMVDMAVDTVMERGRLMPSQDTTEEDMAVMVDMDVDTVMERGRLMPSQDTAVDMDMAVMVFMAMEDMVIAVKFFPLF